MRRQAPTDGLREAVIEGFSRRPRRIPCRYLYDAEGSALFDRITELPEYYLSRTEIALLERHARDIARHVGPGALVIEFGAGCMTKTRPLLSALDSPSAYVPVDVAREALLLSARRLTAEHPALPVIPLVADFLRPVTLPPQSVSEGPALAFFPGSTIGNLRPAEARDFLRRTARLVGRGGWMVVGVDLAKDPQVIEAAYDDAQGLTATFIRNLIVRIERDLAAGLDPGAFDHSARWNAREGCVEVFLVANRRQEAELDGKTFTFRRGDRIHVEDCYKYGIEQFHWLARQGGFTPETAWTDEDGLFSLHLLRVA